MENPVPVFKINGNIRFLREEIERWQRYCPFCDSWIISVESSRQVLRRSGRIPN
jgi:hypothetical protein